MIEVVLLLAAYAFALDCLLRETQVYEAAPDLWRLFPRPRGAGPGVL